MASGLKDLGLCWWCRGAGAAVLALLAAVLVFRAPHDLIFWAAWTFFAIHTVTTVIRFRRARHHRTTVAVTRTHHRTKPPLPPIVFAPVTATAALAEITPAMSAKSPTQQTKKAS